MLPPESRLEVRTRLPAKPNRKPPLLFVHGGYCDAWCWEPYFLPYFAAQGYAAHALSLRGHGASGGREALFVTGLDDYVADVEQIAGSLPSPPVLIGHSMGAAVIERMLTTRPIRSAALLAPILRRTWAGGAAPARLAARIPGQHASADAPHERRRIGALRPMYSAPAFHRRSWPRRSTT
jgi:pimeloyl-ACP methyl ester carboxylesterase